MKEECILLVSPGLNVKLPIKSKTWGIHTSRSDLEFLAKISTTKPDEILISEQNHKRVLRMLDCAEHAREKLRVDYKIALHMRRDGAVPDGIDKQVKDLEHEYS